MEWTQPTKPTDQQTVRPTDRHMDRWNDSCISTKNLALWGYNYTAQLKRFENVLKKKTDQSEI